MLRVLAVVLFDSQRTDAESGGTVNVGDVGGDWDTQEQNRCLCDKSKASNTAET
jgi:hypothetical protein